MRKVFRKLLVFVIRLTHVFIGATVCGLVAACEDRRHGVARYCHVSAKDVGKVFTLVQGPTIGEADADFVTGKFREHLQDLGEARSAEPQEEKVSEYILFILCCIAPRIQRRYSYNSSTDLIHVQYTYHLQYIYLYIQYTSQL